MNLINFLTIIVAAYTTFYLAPQLARRPFSWHDTILAGLCRTCFIGQLAYALGGRRFWLTVWTHATLAFALYCLWLRARALERLRGQLNARRPDGRA